MNEQFNVGSGGVAVSRPDTIATWHLDIPFWGNSPILHLWQQFETQPVSLFRDRSSQSLEPTHLLRDLFCCFFLLFFRVFLEAVVGMYRCLLDSIMPKYASLKSFGGCVCVVNTVRLTQREIPTRLLCHVNTLLTICPDRVKLICILLVVERFRHYRTYSCIVIA